MYARTLTCIAFPTTTHIDRRSATRIDDLHHKQILLVASLTLTIRKRVSKSPTSVCVHNNKKIAMRDFNLLPAGNTIGPKDRCVDYSKSLTSMVDSIMCRCKLLVLYTQKPQHSFHNQIINELIPTTNHNNILLITMKKIHILLPLFFLFICFQRYIHTTTSCPPTTPSSSGLQRGASNKSKHFWSHCDTWRPSSRIAV